MTGKERVLRALEFKHPDKVPIFITQLAAKDFKTDFDKKFGNDIAIYRFPENRKIISANKYFDEWNCGWELMSTMGEVKDHPIKSWEDDFENMTVPPDFSQDSIRNMKEFFDNHPEKFKLGQVWFLMFERMHFLRGFSELLEDLYLERENAERLADIIIDYQIKKIDVCARAGCDGIFCSDDWGIQDSLIINPNLWRDFFKPRYKRIIDAAHERGLKIILHSCGYIIDIIEDFIELGLDALQCDQQDNMGIDKLSERFGGRITFVCPTDLQTALCTNDPVLIDAKAKELVEKLGGFGGGFIAKTYTQPDHINVTEESVLTMLEAFSKYGKYNM